MEEYLFTREHFYLSAIRSIKWLLLICNVLCIHSPFSWVTSNCFAQWMNSYCFLVRKNYIIYCWREREGEKLSKVARLLLTPQKWTCTEQAWLENFRPTEYGCQKRDKGKHGQHWYSLVGKLDTTIGFQNMWDPGRIVVFLFFKRIIILILVIHIHHINLRKYR